MGTIPHCEAAITKERSGMLVLSRKVDESIEIGDDVKVTVVQISGGAVRIGIEAPGMKIWRTEIADERRAGVRR